MKLLLCRSGHVEGATPLRFRGRREQRLTEYGVQQAHILGARIAAEWTPSCIYTSPSSRSVETGDAIAAATGTPTKVNALFAACDYGFWSGMEYPSVAKEDPVTFQAWFERPHLVRIPGGDSLQAMVSRTADGLRHLLKTHRDDTIVVVAHFSSVRALLLQLLDIPLSAFQTIPQDPACLNEIDLVDGRVEVIRVNETGFLADIRRP